MVSSTWTGLVDTKSNSILLVGSSTWTGIWNIYELYGYLDAQDTPKKEAEKVTAKEDREELVN